MRCFSVKCIRYSEGSPRGIARSSLLAQMASLSSAVMTNEADVMPHLQHLHRFLSDGGKRCRDVLHLCLRARWTAEHFTIASVVGVRRSQYMPLYV